MMAFTVEPVMHVVIIVPQECAARVEARLPHHRGRVQSSRHRDGQQTIGARIPQAEVPAFITALVQETGGRARTSMVLFEYWPVAERPPLDPAAGVRQPVPRIPTGRSGAVAVPEPED